MSPRLTKAQREARILERDARNRALRTFVQGLAIDVLVAAAVVIQGVAASNDPIHWPVVAASLGRSVAQAIASYVMRRFLDRSKVPTPLPPAEAGEPDADAGGINGGLVLTIAAGILLGLIVAALLDAHITIH